MEQSYCVYRNLNDQPDFRRRSTMSNRKTTQASFSLENLEGRQLLSAASLAHHEHAAHAARVARRHSSTSSLLSTASNPNKGAPVSTLGSGSTLPTVPGFQVIQFQNAPSAVQATLHANVSATISPTQNVVEETIKGTTHYVLSLSDAGTRTTVIVDASGTLISVDINTTIQFSAAPSVVQTGMQALAPSGVTIAPTQNVIVNTLNGNTTYTASVIYGKSSGVLPRAKMIIVNSQGQPVGGNTSASAI
jgi:hypothetical protein